MTVIYETDLEREMKTDDWTKLGKSLGRRPGHTKQVSESAPVRPSDLQLPLQVEHDRELSWLEEPEAKVSLKSCHDVTFLPRSA